MKTYRELLIFLQESGAKQIAIGCIFKTGIHEETLVMPKLNKFLSLAKWGNNLHFTEMIDMTICENVIYAIRW